MKLGKVEKLKRKIELAYAEIDLIQQQCQHLNQVRVNKADTGNYDPSCDRYWVDVECKDCSKKWNEDQRKSR